MPVPEPSPAVLKKLAQRPLPVAASTVFACQRSGWWNAPGLEEYRDVDLAFLERHHGYATDNLSPPRLAAFIRRRLGELGVAEMTAGDDRRLRSLGEIFWPGEAAAPLESQALA